MIHAAAILLVHAVALGASNPPAAPAAPVRADDASTIQATRFERTLDSLQDVKPGSSEIARFPAAIRSARLELGAESPRLRQRAAEGAQELLAVDASDAATPMGALRWEGAALLWSWSRATPRKNAESFDAFDTLLPGSTIVVELVDGSTQTLRVAPPQVRIAMARTGATRVRVPALALRPLVPGFAGGESGADGWTVEQGSSPDRWTLRRPEILVELEFLRGESTMTVHATAPADAQLVQARAKLASLRAELQRRNEEERQIVQTEIDGVVHRIAELEAVARAAPPWTGSVPTLQLRDPQGRVAMVVELSRK